MEENNKNIIVPDNIYFINVAKTLAIFLIILGHLPIPHDLYAFINCFRMPLFFIITGYLIKANTFSLKNLISRKAKTILLPYYIFAFISILFWCFLGRYYGEDAMANGNLKDYIIGAIFAIPTKTYMGFNFPIWFLPSLFCTEIIFFCSKRIFKKNAWIFFIFCFGIGILLKEYNIFRLPYGLDVSLFALAFIQVGQFLKEKNLIAKYITNQNIWTKLCIACIFIFITIFISQINQEEGTISMVNRTFNNYILYFLGAFSGSLFILYFSNCCLSYRLFNFYGRNTIILLGFHLMTFSIIKGIQVFIIKIPLDVTEGHVCTYILYTLLVFIFLAPIIYIVNTYIPFILGRKKGIL